MMHRVGVGVRFLGWMQAGFSRLGVTCAWLYEALLIGRKPGADIAGVRLLQQLHRTSFQLRLSAPAFNIVYIRTSAAGHALVTTLRGFLLQV